MIINSFKTSIQPNFTANIMPKNCAEHINKQLKSAKSVDIFCHTSSDEDTFNSAKAMYSYLQNQGIKPRIIVSGGKDNYKYDTEKYNIIQDNRVNKDTKKADLALCVDFSSPNRVSANTLKYLKSYGNKIVGFDHHNDPDLITKNYNKITEAYAKTQTLPDYKPQNYYIDASAKSNCAIISRFFDAIGHRASHEEARSLFAGMFDDTSKDGITRVNKLGKVKVSEKVDDFGNTKEVMKNVLGRMRVFDKLAVLKHFADKTKLTEKEITFSKTLNDKTQYSQNGKFAYIEISPNDKEWEDLGKDTTRAKKVLQQFRKDALNNENIDTVAVFYPTNTGNYKMSIQTKADYAKQIIDNIKATTYPELIAGGHENRSGGSIETLDTQKCHEWVNLFKNSAEQILH